MLDFNDINTLDLYDQLRHNGGSVICQSIGEDNELFEMELIALMGEKSESENDEGTLVGIYTDGKGVYSVARLLYGKDLCAIGFKLKENIK